LGRVVVRAGMEIMVHMGFLSINMVRKGIIRQTRNKNIKERKRPIRFYFHSILNKGSNAIEMVKKGMEGLMTMLSNDESVINKPKPTFRLEMPRV